MVVKTTGRKKNGLTLKVCPVLLLVVKVKIEPNILGYSSMSLPFTEDTGLLRQLPIMSQFPFSSGACADLPPARLQYIQQMFAEVIGGGDPGSGSTDAGRTPEQTMRWIHDRLFVEGWQIAAVRAELLRARQNVRAIAVTSGKGGVGKTTFAVNLAVACAMEGQRVLLFDADFGLANVHVFAGVNPKATILEVVDGRARLADIVVPGPGGVQVICGASGVGRLANLDLRTVEALGRELMQVAADFDVLVIDTGAGVSSTVTHFLGLAQEAVVVSTPNLAATLDAYGVLKVAHEAGLKTTMKLLVNQAEDFNEAKTVLGRIVGCASRFLKTTPRSLGFLERDPAFEQACHHRQPLVLSDSTNLNALRIAAMAGQLVPSLARIVPLPESPREPDLSLPAENRLSTTI
jgi:flagellar biosynthesis protein FlhG